MRAGLKRIGGGGGGGGGGGPFYGASCEEAEGSSPGFSHFNQKYSLYGRIFATVAKILSCTIFSPAQ